MNVLVATNMYPTEASPFYGIFVKEQVDSLRNEGISVDVFFINGKENRLNYFKSIIPLLKKLKSNSYDIIHAHHTYCIYPIIIARAIKGIKTPLVLTFHEGEVHKTNEFLTNNINIIKRLVFSKGIKHFALKMTDMVITVEEKLIEALDFKGKYLVLPCGVDLEMFKTFDKKRCRQKLNLPLNKKIIFFPASPNNSNKGIDILNEALNYLNLKDIHLLTAGNIHHQDMPYYMSAADVVVQLSFYEASPMVLKEAMAVNVPVVFTEVGDAKLTMGTTKGCFICKRNPHDVALKLKSALNCNGNSNGRNRIVKVGLGLSELSKRIINVYENLSTNNQTQ